MRASGSAPALRGEGGLPYLNVSQILEWFRCRYRWELGTLRHIQSRAVVRTLDLGSAVHAGMHAGILLHAKAKKAPKLVKVTLASTAAIDAWVAGEIKIRGGKERLTEEDSFTLGTLQHQAYEIAANVLDKMNLERWETVWLKREPLAERAFTCAVPEHLRHIWAGMHGTPDWVVVDHEDGARLVTDYKVRLQFTDAEDEEVDLQLASYQRLLRENGVDTDGSLKFQIKSKVESTPSVNKNGSMSRQQISCTWDTYRRHLLANGLDPADYTEMASKLEYEAFRLTRAFRGQTEVDAIWHNVIIPAAHDIAQSGMGDPLITHYRSLGSHTCRQKCWGRDFCLAELRGDDTDFLLQTRYVDMDNPQERVILGPDDVVFDDED